MNNTNNTIDDRTGETPEYSGSRAVIESLLQEGVEVIFGYPGGSIIPVYDILYDYRDRLHHVLTRHEQGAVHAAQGYARVSSRVGVCMVTSGPGATNTITGLADAMADSTPLVLITGQVGSAQLGTNAFQEVDIIAITRPVTKWNCQVRQASEIAGALSRAFYLARSGRPGPVVIDITKDAQLEMTRFRYEPTRNVRGYVPYPIPDQRQVDKAVALIREARRPMILFGQGVTLGGAEEEFRAFVEKSDIPAASTLLGLSTLPVTHPRYAGLLGMHGNYAPNIKNRECDLLVAVGMRFDDRVTGNPLKFGENARIVHLEIDPAEINKIIRVDVPVLGDVKETLPLLTAGIEQGDHEEWMAGFRACAGVEERETISPAIHPGDAVLHMGEVVRAASEIYDDDAVLVTDVGQQQLFACRYFGYKRPRSVVTSGGLGTMGFGLPAAIGASLGAPHRDVCLFAGDGGLQMTIQELATVAQLGLPVKILLMNNGFLGMVRQWQELFFHKRYSFTAIANPEFEYIARAHRVAYRLLERREDLHDAIREMKEHPGPFLLEVKVMQEENVFPMIPVGAAVSDILLK
ncbi:MAG: biosynthetic-type acetolactate synthase large subunit [Odoribacteraceae bacterium]|jgi:acetolactate synthase-1/2/3 large subunit|nr:biosynthetic-type acetolactate synthase large subunit [Odoribacteraceae bacterium]